MKINFFFFIILFITSNIFGQNDFVWNSKNDKISIKFEYISNLIIIPIELNEVKLNMILDTGSESSYIFSLPEHDSIAFIDTKKIKIKGFGSLLPIEVLISEHNTAKTLGYENLNFPILIILNQDLNFSERLGTPVNGILNNSFFKNNLVQIDYLKKKITIYKDDTILQKKKFEKYERLPITTFKNRPYINVATQINDQIFDLNLLIDTGLGSGLWLFEDDKIKSNENYFEDILGLGLSGEIIGKKSRVTEVKVAKYALQNVLVSYPYEIYLPNSEILKERNGSIGGEIFKRFNVFFNYPKNEIYLKKNNNFSKPFNYNMSGIEVQHNGIEFIRETVKLPTTKSQGATDEYVLYRDNDFKYKFELKSIFEIASVRPNSPAEIAGIKVGDKIIKLNKKQIYKYTIEKINEMMQSEEGKWIYIDIERKGVPIAFKFQLKKII